jgi:hypothetical protein
MSDDGASLRDQGDEQFLVFVCRCHLCRDKITIMTFIDEDEDQFRGMFGLETSASAKEVQVLQDLCERHMRVILVNEIGFRLFPGPVMTPDSEDQALVLCEEPHAPLDLGHELNSKVSREEVLADCDKFGCNVLLHSDSSDLIVEGTEERRHMVSFIQYPTRMHLLVLYYERTLVSMLEIWPSLSVDWDSTYYY